MKCNAKGILFLIAAFLIVYKSDPAMAEPNIDQLTPNTYEKKEFNKNTDFLHEKSLSERRQSIPEEQKGLTFIKPSSDPMEKIQEQLFSQSTKENNTIRAKAQQMQLFSGEEERQFITEEDTGTTAEKESGLSLLYIVLLVAGILVVFAFLIPKMAQSKEFEKKVI
ncbi:type VII secretion protein EssA [Bacillus sp. T33-2]|uniref:type VII secretion protein EssA n=1 Tax=Bacillus sp. T33-2 TaxID=2054168 RepID=UPI000C759F65|nr:type VII secretion protein EssA [Bacillus sp. T33-2]PLR96526.1 type VII secretion protein EssA [Bacillus sp. T33-2]